MAKKSKPKLKPIVEAASTASEAEVVRIRQRDTGAIRELSAWEWRAARATLEAAGFVRVTGPDDREAFGDG